MTPLLESVLTLKSGANFTALELKGEIHLGNTMFDTVAADSRETEGRI